MSYSTKMAPNQHHAHRFMLPGLPLEPVSRTYQYRKIMKPMLERKRRARINKCLDELKDLMTSTLQADGENLSKLEKADILELTVRHLQRLRESNGLFVRNSDTLNMEKFWAGFQHCAVEVSHFLQKYDQQNKPTNGDLIKYIANYIPNMATAVAAAAVAANATNATPPPPPALPTNAHAAPLQCGRSSSVLVNTTNMTDGNNFNEHYQRYSTGAALRLLPAEATNKIATNNIAPPQTFVRVSPAAATVSNLERIWEVAARAANRLHPYGDAVGKAAMTSRFVESPIAEVFEVGSDDASSCRGYGDCGDSVGGNSDIGSAAGDGFVWRPW